MTTSEEQARGKMASDRKQQTLTNTRVEVRDDTAMRKRRERARKLARDLPEVDPGDYEILHEVARGGLGVIHAALDLRLGREVAIKELLVPDGDALDRFRREVEITAALQHPNIIPLHEAGRWPDGRPFYAMKLVDGKPLAAVITSCKTREERLALLPHVTAVAEAMAYAHEQSIIHRDLKPPNILVGAFGETVVIDWGLGKALDDDEERAARQSKSIAIRHGSFDTSDGAILGTPSYMAPEQARGEAADERSDVYSLGAMLYHLLSGDRAYKDNLGPSPLKRLHDKPPTSLAALQPNTPRDLIAITEKAMARDPRRRYQDAGEMAEELRRFSLGLLVGARQYSKWELFRRFVARYRGVFAVATIAVVVLGIVGIWSFNNIRHERRIAQESERETRAAKSKIEDQLARTILEDARVLLDVDPTRALARLKTLTSPLPGAASVAADAEERGVAYRTLAGHRDIVWTAAFSPNGAQIASSSSDGEVRLWSADDGGVDLLVGHKGRVSALAFSPSGQDLATASYDHTIRIWPVRGGDSRILSGHTGEVHALTYSPDGVRIASVSAEDRTVRIWNLVGGALLASDLLTNNDVVRMPVSRDVDLAFSPDGSKLASASHDGAVLVWHLPDGRKQLLKGHRADITDIAFSGDGSKLVSCGRDRTVRLWNLKTGKGKTIAELGDQALAVAYSPNGRRIAFADLGGEVGVVEPGISDPEVLGRHQERVTSLSFSPDGRRLVSTSWDKTARVWRLDHGAHSILTGHRDVVSAASFSPDGTRLVTSSWDKTLRQWQVPVNPRAVLRGHTVGVKAVAFGKGDRLASAGHDNTVRVWNRSDGTSAVLAGHTDHVFEVVFSPDDRFIATSSDDQSVRVWPVGGGPAKVLSGHSADVEALAYSASGQYLASASEDNSAVVWQLPQGKAIHVLPHGDHVSALAFAISENALATASLDGVVRWWVLGGDAAREIGRHEGGVFDLALSDSKKQLFTVGADAALRVWNLDGTPGAVFDANLSGARALRLGPVGLNVAVIGSELGAWLCEIASKKCRQFRGHGGAILDAEFSSDGRLLATASADNTVRLWDISSGESRVLRGHTAPIFDVDFSRDGNVLATASADGTIRIWPVKAPPPPASLREWLDKKTTEVRPANQ